MGLRELAFEPGEMIGDQFRTRGRVGRGEHGTDLTERHVEVAEPANDLRDRNLIGRVAAIAGSRVDLRGNEQPDVVVVAQGLDAQLGGLREVTDHERRRHGLSIDSPARGESRRGRGLDSPAAGSVTIVSYLFDKEQ